MSSQKYSWCSSIEGCISGRNSMEDYKKNDVSQRKLEAKLEAEILYLSLFFKKKKKDT